MVCRWLKCGKIVSYYFGLKLFMYGNCWLSLIVDFDYFYGVFLGVISVFYNLGGFLVLFVVFWVIDWIGCKYSIILGLIVLVIGIIF